MRRQEIITGFAICVGFTAFALINHPSFTITKKESLSRPHLISDSLTAVFNPNYGLTPKTNNRPVDYSVRGLYRTPIIIEQALTANTLNDLIAGYPSKWISEYVSVELITIENDQKTSHISNNEILSNSQKIALSKLSLNDEIQIVVKYNSINTITKETDESEFKSHLTIIPNTQASNKIGFQKMSTYFSEQIGNRITRDELGKELTVIIFLVDSDGMVKNTKVGTSSGSEAIDQLLMETLIQMPKWNPAKDAQGNPVPQRFKLVTGFDGC